MVITTLNLVIKGKNMSPLDRRVKRTYDLEPYQVEALKVLTKKTRVKQVDYVREAIDV